MSSPSGSLSWRARGVRAGVITLAGAIGLALAEVADIRYTDGAVSAQEPRFTSALLDGIQFRNLGPFRAGGWISDIAVPERPEPARLYTFYIAARNGGVWKTTNNGTTFDPIFDDHDAQSIGALAVAPSDANVVWVGTGDASSTRSAYPGNGIYKSTDAGKSFQRMGLEDSHHIARIVVHPTRPDVVYVAAMGHLYTPNGERGVFRTTDGGRTWTRVLYLDDRTGAIDLVLNRRDPDVLFAAMYESGRQAWHFDMGGPRSGVYRTDNGGRTWTKLAGGLPDGPVGRIGLDIYQRDPRIVGALVENVAPRAATAEELQRAKERGLPPPRRVVGGELYRSEDGGRTWKKMNRAEDDLASKAGYSFAQLRIDTGNPQRMFVTSDAMLVSEDAGRTWSGLTFRTQTAFRSAFGDMRALWWDPINPQRIILGSDGGVHVSYDGGKTNDYLPSLKLGEIYALSVDNEDPYHIYAGLQDHEMWKGPVNGWSGRVGLEDWVTVGTGDGMYTLADPTDSRWVYTTQQFGDHHRVDQQARTRTRIVPPRAEGEPASRYNWVAPLHLSPHNSQILYAGSQRLYRSLDRGDHWQAISPDLTTNDAEKIALNGPSIRFCTMTTIAESAHTPGLIWVGTDDGRVQVTRDGGVSWTDVTPAVAQAGGPVDGWVSRVVASRRDPAVAYVTKTRHRQDDFRAFVFKTTDGGKSWRAIATGLPQRPVNVLVEDPVKADLLFAGTDHGVYVSIDSGARWVRLRGDMPPVPVHDLVVHPRDGDLVVGTYGRGLYVTDIRPLREIAEPLLSQPSHLFAIPPTARRHEGAWGNYDLYGDRFAHTRNAPNGVPLWLYLRDHPGTDAKATIVVKTTAGEEVRRWQADVRAGLNRLIWDLAPSGGPGGGGGSRPPSPGEYVVAIDVAGQQVNGRATVLPSRVPD